MVRRSDFSRFCRRLLPGARCGASSRMSCLQHGGQSCEHSAVCFIGSTRAGLLGCFRNDSRARTQTLLIHHSACPSFSSCHRAVAVACPFLQSNDVKWPAVCMDEVRRAIEDVRDTFDSKEEYETRPVLLLISALARERLRCISSG